MSDETTIPDPEVTTEPEVVEVATEAPPEPAVDYEALKAENDKKERNLNKWSMELAERERRLAAPAASAAPEAVSEVDPENLKAVAPYVKAIIESDYAPKLNAAEAMMESFIEDDLTRFAKDKGIEPDDIMEVITQRNLSAQGPALADVRKVFQDAYDIMQASSFDPVAKEAELREKILKELAEQGAEIVSVKEGRAAGSKPTLDTDSMSMDERYDYLKSKEGR
jgi:hypothetical protein